MARENYVGRAGQLAAMAEFLLRGYNVAIPEVDEGDDIFVVTNRVDRLWRVQVKTAIGVRRAYGSSGQFLIPLAQLRDVRRTDLFYVLCLRGGTSVGFRGGFPTRPAPRVPGPPGRDSDGGQYPPLPGVQARGTHLLGAGLARVSEQLESLARHSFLALGCHSQTTFSIRGR
jgi:hypothetical protein